MTAPEYEEGAQTVRARRRAARAPYRKAMDHIDWAIVAIYEAEDGMPMCCAENARIYLLDAKTALTERMEEMAARITNGSDGG